MIARGFLTLAAALAGSTICTPCRAQPVDGVFIQSTPQRDAPSYESDYAAEARLNRGGGTPEADARPGEYYFLQGAEAFRKHDYKFAIDMYQVAASWAYKPAEYNLGVMYARGQGVPVDLARGMAWMALAAERGEKHYVDAREVVYALLTKEQWDQANVIWRELKKAYADEVALKRAKRRWAEVRSHITGSRVGSVGNLTVGMPIANGGVTKGQKIVVSTRGNGEGKKARGIIQHGSGGTTTAAEVLGGNGVNGSTAYRQLLQSDNPYDPKFRNLPGGTAIVGPPEPVKAKSSVEGEAKDGDPPSGDRD